MSKNDICEKVMGILKQTLDYNNGLIPTTYTEEFGERLSSIEFVTFIVEIESEFEIEIDDDDFELNNMDTVEKIANLVTRYLSEEASQ